MAFVHFFPLRCEFISLKLYWQIIIQFAAEVQYKTSCAFHIQLKSKSTIGRHQRTAFHATKLWDGPSFILTTFHYIKIRHRKCISWDDLKSKVENHNSIMCDCMQLHIYCKVT